MPDERVIEYAGTVKKWSDYTDRQSDYSCLMGLGRGRVIDPRLGGNISRYINHSCEPNCEALIIGEKVFICTITPVAKGTELTISYSLMPPGNTSKDHSNTYVCRCGSAHCRGTMLMQGN